MKLLTYIFFITVDYCVTEDQTLEDYDSDNVTRTSKVIIRTESTTLSVIGM